ncbi:glycoside hydrolase family 26 protein [Conexibacter sp. SYSU D00693]|uniref:glycoside hydrolase family 26 protein n=1 Tax=Conexibacter sp. SYSU D00693 TaxID=2812560 RepID=UPI00196B0E2A|nr:glycosyl hydrolase [Conexibacter sp. SYSU D00693]
MSERPADRRRGRLVAPLLLAVAVLGLLAAQLRTADGEDARPVPRPWPRAEAAGARITLGVTTVELARNSYRRWRQADLRSVNAFEQAARHHAGIVMWFSDWARVPSPDVDQLRWVARRGSVPEITWEPWDSEKGLNVPQPAYRLRRIIAGDFDPLVRRWARALSRYGQPVRLRFGHEMNGNWYPWNEAANGNRHGEYVRAWRRIWRIFREAGAFNVQWVWSPVALEVYASQYPGDRYVDRVGLTGFVGGVQLRFQRYRPFTQLAGPAVRALRRIAPGKPVEISEMGAAEQGGDKAAWFTGMFAALERTPQIDALVWFELDKGSDWRIRSSHAARRAFAAGLDGPAFRPRSRRARLPPPLDAQSPP